MGREEPHTVPSTEPTLEFASGFLLVEELQIDEIGDLLDIGDGVRDPSSPEDVGYPVELTAQSLVHRVPPSTRGVKNVFVEPFNHLPETLFTE